MISRNLSAVMAVMLVCVLVLLPIMLSGCEETPGSSQSDSSLIEPTQAPTEEPSSETEAEASVDPEPTEAPDSADGFEEAFSENPIDARLADDLSTASSSSAILKAYNNAEKYWSAMVPLAYDAAMAVLDGDDKAQLEKDYENWDNFIIGTLPIGEGATEADKKIFDAKATQEAYREIARDLCKVVYEKTGKLPDFAPAMSDGPKG